MSGAEQQISATRRILPMIALVTGAVAIDQLIKWLVETRLPFHELVPVVPMLALYRTWNEGIAFSLLKGLPDTGLLALTGLVIVFVLYLWWRTPPGRRIAHLGYALIIGFAYRDLNLRRLWEALIATTLVSASILFIQEVFQNGLLAQLFQRDHQPEAIIVGPLQDEGLRLIFSLKQQVHLRLPGVLMYSSAKFLSTIW